MNRTDVRIIVAELFGDTLSGFGVYPLTPVNQQTVHLHIENRTTDPLSPLVGRIWLRTDL